MLPHEARDAAPVPQRSPREKASVRLPLPFVVHDGRGDVPTLPPRPRRAITQVDVLAVEAKAGVEAADLVEHVAAEENEPAEQPVRLHRPRDVLAEVVVRTLAFQWTQHAPKRCAAAERSAHGREAATRRNELTVEPKHPRAGHAAARPRLGE